jgi:YesN/AraC family two-component response regulator
MLCVDDEPPVRTLICNCIDWQALGIEIAGEAGNGQEALDLTEKLDPDIICLDICMPGMSGIDLAAELKKRKPGLSIVIISGHDTFAYAQQCIRLGVTDYLLKPVNEEQLTQVMQDILKRIKPDNVLLSRSRGSIREVLAYLKENFRDPGLTLQSAADRFYINPSYLSRAFKQDTGKTFVEYLTGLRVEEAARLLTSCDLRSYEAGEQVGIPDAKYFGVCFKKYKGLTLAEFRKRAVRQTRAPGAR